MKLTKAINHTMTTYKTENGFMVDVVKYIAVDKEDYRNAMQIESWLYHKDYGIKMFMFGVENKNDDLMMELIEGNLESYIDEYIEEYMQD